LGATPRRATCAPGSKSSVGKVRVIPWGETNTLEAVAAGDQGNVIGGFTNTMNSRRFVKK
jgi:hypothetical protein